MIDADVVIVGAGLSGLACAIAARNGGREVLVLERADSLTEAETGITVWAFAVSVLHRLGAGDEICDLGAPLDRLQSLTADGHVLSDLDLRPAHRALGAMSYDLDRSRLQRALARRLGPDRVRFLARCEAVDDDDGAPVVSLTDGATIPSGIVVGADGIHSTVRRYVAGDVPVRRGGFGAWRGVAEVGGDVVAPGTHVRLYGPSAVFGAARLDARRVRWYAGTRLAGGAEGSVATLRDSFGAWAEPAPTILTATADSSILFHDTPTLSPLRNWTRGRVALIGDAAHAAMPTLGIGAGLALADGEALAVALSEHRSAEAALAAYAAERRAVGRRVQRTARAFTQIMGVRRASLLALRRWGMSGPFVSFQERGVGWLMRGAQTPRPRRLGGQ